MAENLKLAKALREAEMRPTPRSGLTGMLADALMGARNFADRAKVPDFVPLIGGEGVGSLLVGKAPEEVNELSYGNSPIQMNPYAGRTASFVPEMKRGRGQQLADALSLLSLPGGKTAASMMMGPGVDAAMFIGPKAKTWDAAAAARAVEMEKAGVPAKQIWSETGTFRGADGKLRQEIDDSEAKLLTNPLPMTEVKGRNYADFKVGDALNHSPLFDAYPDLGGIRQSFSKGTGSRGEYRPSANWISLDEQFKGLVYRPKDQAQIDAANELYNAYNAGTRPKRYDAVVDALADRHGLFGPEVDLFINRFGRPVETERRRLSALQRDAVTDAAANATGEVVLPTGRSTMLHELQHAVQEREGFARGGNTREMAIEKDALLGRAAYLNAELSNSARVMDREPKDSLRYAQAREDYDAAMAEKLRMNPSIFQSEPKDLYRRLAGEAEARATQARMNMTPAERRAMFPYESYDVPVNQLIVR